MNVKMKLAVAVATLLAAGGAGLAAATPASASTQLGGVSVAKYCSATALANGAQASYAVSVNNSASGWRCNDQHWNGLYWWSQLRGVDMNRACSIQYGPGAWAYDPTSTLLGWRCYR